MSFLNIVPNADDTWRVELRKDNYQIEDARSPLPSQAEALSLGQDLWGADLPVTYADADPDRKVEICHSGFLWQWVRTTNGATQATGPTDELNNVILDAVNKYPDIPIVMTDQLAPSPITQSYPLADAPAALKYGDPVPDAPMGG